MSSSIFFRFKSQKESQRVQFDGTSISVWEAKREIISISKLGDGTDFDLAIYNADSNEEYDDDTTLIPRSTTVIARRLPAAKSGQGRAARYVSGRMPVNARNSHRVEAPGVSTAVQAKPMSVASNSAQPQTEEERIAAMFAEGSSQWRQQKEQMATQVQAPRTGNYKPGNAKAAPDHPPPPGYLCYRCGEKGHWIQACPTNNDPAWEGRPRVKRTTGIPKSQLKTIEKPKALTNDGLTDDARQPSGVMVNADGEYVVAVPDQKSWEQYQTKAQASAEQAQASQAGDAELQSRGLQCPLDKRLFVDPVKTPCCGTIYCNECIDNALANSDLVCPGCSTADVLIDDVIPDEETGAKIKAYEEEKKAEKQKAEKPAGAVAGGAGATAGEAGAGAVGIAPAATTSSAATAAVPATETPQTQNADKADNGSEENKSKPASPTRQNEMGNQAETDRLSANADAARSVSPAASATSSTNKRKASDDNSAEQRIPTGPKAMRAAQPTTTGPQAPTTTTLSSFDANFVEQMNKLAGTTAAPNDMPSFPMDMAMPPMMQGMASGMNPAMMMGMMNPMMMQQMAMGGMPNFGMPNMSGANHNYGNGHHGYYNHHHQQQQQQQQQQQHHWNNYANGYAGHGGYNGIPSGPTDYDQSNDDDAYMRKPVNPGRYQGRARKPRAADFKEL